MPPIRWRVHQGDILDVAADVLVCPANPFLTLSGGVGGALLLRYGASLQTELADYLARLGRRYLDRGSVIITRPANAPYAAVIHAVAVNGFYESSSEVITEVVRAALRAAAACGARGVAPSALATGYGRLSIGQFARGLLDVVPEDFPPINDVIVGVRGADDVLELGRVVPTVAVA
jgi:O-acetyl-ADP-ribose deacetylase (regulator of RNase III)